MSFYNWTREARVLGKALMVVLQWRNGEDCGGIQSLSAKALTAVVGVVDWARRGANLAAVKWEVKWS